MSDQVRVINAVNHPVDLDDGRVLPIGGSATVDRSDRITQLLDTRQLNDITPTTAPAPSEPTRGRRRTAAPPPPPNARDASGDPQED